MVSQETVIGRKHHFYGFPRNCSREENTENFAQWGTALMGYMGNGGIRVNGVQGYGAHGQWGHRHQW